MLAGSALVDQTRSRLRVRRFDDSASSEASNLDDKIPHEQKIHTRPSNESKSPFLAARNFLHKAWALLHPRITPASATNLAVARVILMIIALLETPSSPQSLLLGHSASVIHPRICTGLPSWTGWTRWETLDMASVAGRELLLLHWAILFGMVGFLTNLAVGATGVLFMRFYVSQPAMGFLIGHPGLWIAPVLLLMAAAPCGDTLSLDSAVFWAFKASSLARGDRKQAPQIPFWTRVWNGMMQSGQRECYRYSIPLALMACFIGLVLLSAGYQKATTGPYPLFSWAFSDVMLIEMRTGWLKHHGRPYIPTLAQAGWNPFRAMFHSFLLPVLRLDMLPILLHVGSEIAMIWECTHMFLLLASPRVKYAAIAMDVSFHLGVSWFVGIPIFMPMAMAHLMFLPWASILQLDKLPLAPKEPSREQQLDPEIQSPEPPAGSLPSPKSATVHGDRCGWRDRCKLEVAADHACSFGRNLAILLSLVVGLPIVFFQARLTLRNSPMHCHPFDAYPGFSYKTPLRVWQNEPRLADGRANWGWFSSLTRSRRVVVTYTDGTIVEIPMMRLLCDIEGHSPCILSADLYLNDRAHSDSYRAWRQGTFWPFLAAKARIRPGRDAFWRLAALITASTKVLDTALRDDVAHVSFLVNGNARVDFDQSFEQTEMAKLSCEVIVRSSNKLKARSVPPPPPCDSSPSTIIYQDLEIDFGARKMCDVTPGVLKPVREEICKEWEEHALGH